MYATVTVDINDGNNRSEDTTISIETSPGLVLDEDDFSLVAQWVYNALNNTLGSIEEAD